MIKIILEIFERVKLAIKSFGVDPEISKPIYQPALLEIGKSFGDQVKAYRLKNLVRIVKESDGLLVLNPLQETCILNPKLAIEIFHEGSKESNDGLVKMWGGLLASSFSLNGDDDSNLIFIGLIKQMTATQAKILNYVSENSIKHIDTNHLIYGESIKVPTKTLLDLTGKTDINILDQEMDHMRFLGLLQDGSGFTINQSIETTTLHPTPLALNLFVKCKGFRGSASEYWNLEKALTLRIEDEPNSSSVD